MTSAATPVFAVLGDPVAHSLSPLMHNAGFRAAGLDAVYVAMQPDADGLAGVMHALVRRGGGGNITIPFKHAAAAIDAGRDELVGRLAAANVFGSASGALRLGNTDVAGILAAIDRLEVRTDAWCIFGTGGSAKSVVGAAASRGARVAVVSRDQRRAEAFTIWLRALGVGEADRNECDLVINATPLGLVPGDGFPVAPSELRAGTAVLDLVYAPAGTTTWVAACSARGLCALDGREVLLAQGAASWQFWFPGVDPPIEVMRAALAGRLG